MTRQRPTLSSPQATAITALSCGLMALLSACGGPELDAVTDSVAPELVSGGIPCIYTLANDSASVPNRTFCLTGYQGQACLSYETEVADGYGCVVASDNPLQDAVDWAVASNNRRIRMDPGYFYITRASTTGLPWGYSTHVIIGNNMKVTGVLNSSTRTVLKFTQTTNYGLFFTGDTTNWSPVHDTFLQSFEMQPDVGFTACLKVLSASGGMTFNNLSCMSGGMQFGTYNAFAESSPGSGKGVVMNFNGSPGAYNQITSNYVQGFGRDGIVVVGAYNSVNSNTAQNGTIMSYMGATNNEFIGNLIYDGQLGFDGSYPAYCASFSLPCGQTNEGLQNYAATQGIGKPDGYIRNHSIWNNQIYLQYVNTSVQMLSLWRVSNSNVMYNTVVGTASYPSTSTNQGILLNESHDNFVYGNYVRSTTRAIELSAAGYSENDNVGQLIGSSYNGIGITSAGAASGNDIQANKTGIKLSYNPSAFSAVWQNTIRNNNANSSTVQAFDYSGGPSSGTHRQYCSANSPTSGNYGYNSYCQGN